MGFGRLGLSEIRSAPGRGEPALSSRPEAGSPEARSAGEVRRQHADVLVSGARLGLGGVKTHLWRLCRLLLDEGETLSLYATGSQWEADWLKELRVSGAKIHLPPLRLAETPRIAALYAMLAWPLKIPRRAKSVYCIGAGRSHLLMHRLRPRDAVTINHEVVEPPGPDSLAGTCAARLQATVANSAKVAQKMKGLWPHKPIRVIPFLTSNRPMPAPASRPPVGSGPLRVTYVGRMVEQKRPDQLVRSWQRLTANGVLAGARLDVHGYDPGGEMIPELRAFVNTSAMTEQIRIHGEYGLEELPSIFRETDLVVLPSLWEGLPLVLVEAMQRGVPFVATAAGGTEELGVSNPDVIVTGTEWKEFETGLLTMAHKLRCGEIDHRRLHRWAEDRYGFETVSQSWLKCLRRPRDFFGMDD